MKKIKYYETQRSKTQDGKYRFEENEGWFDKYLDTETGCTLNVVYRKDDKVNNLWKATHLESGVLVTGGHTTKAKCVEGVLRILNRVVKIVNQDKTIQSIIEQLETHRNEVLFNDTQRIDKGA